MRVAIVYPIPFGPDGIYGGGERYAEELAAAMATHVETVLVHTGPHRTSTRRGSLRIETHPWITLLHGLRNNPLSLGFLGSLRQADVVHVLAYHTALADLALMFGKLTGKRVFFTDVGGGGDVTLARLFDMSRLATGFLPISEMEKASFTGGITRRRAILAGVDTMRYRPVAKQRRRSVLYVGRLLPHKGIDYLVQAIDTGTPLTIIGRPYDERYFQLLKRLASGKTVEFITDASDDVVLEHYQSCGVSVLPSVYTTVFGDHYALPDILGFTLLEAMACGSPVICTAVGALPEAVTDGITGYVVPPNDPEALGARIREVLDRPGIALAMGAAAREDILARFTWDAVVERCLDAYETA